MEEEGQNQNSENMSTTSSSAVQKGISSAQKNVANATSQKNLKARVFTKLAPMLGPIIFWATVAVIAIVILVGIGTFLMTTPGIIMDKLEKIARNVVDALQHYFLGDDLTQNVKEEEILGVLDYLENMNYDLKGYGFLTSFVDEEEKTYEDGKPTGSTQYKDGEADGVIRYTDDEGKHSKGDIKEADSKYIFMYLVSDNYIYTVKNNNISFETGDGPLGALASLYIGNIVHSVNFVTQLIDTFTSFHTAGLTSELYGNGLIYFFYEKDGKFGVQGAPFGNDISNQIKIDQEKKTLVIKHSDGLFWANKSEMEYKVDGWAGRYGMPLEFLLSVHRATMMPDLACDMVQLFPTEVQTYLHYVSEYMVKDDEGKEKTVNTYIPYIAKVVNHWYRDVYLVQPEDENVGLVQVDAEYETLVKERWTLYETYTASEAITYGNENLAGEYKLYGLKDNGEYATKVDEVKNHEKAAGKLKIATTEDGHNYVLFVGTIDEANPTLSIMRNAGSSSSPEDTDNSEINEQIESVEDNRIPVAKKALTISFGEMTGQRDDNNDTDGSEINEDTDNETDNSQNNDPIYNLRFIFKNNFSSQSDRPLAQRFTDTSWDDIAMTITNTEEAQSKISRYVSEHSEDYAFQIEQIKLTLNNYGNVQEEGQSDWDFITMHREVLHGRNDDYMSIIDAWGTTITKDEVISLVQNIINNNGPDASAIAEMINDLANSMRETVADNFLENPVEYREDDINDYGWYRTEGVWTAYKLDDNGTFSQEGEGLRTETNPIIKQLFTCNTYFRYDGTKDTAEAIQQLKEAYGIPETSLDYYASSNGKSLDEVLKYKTQLLDESGEDKGNPVTIDEVSGQVALNQDSLNAFSILENTHTLDSDYIYRDFKELVVELGYFTKEELTESIPRILAWLIPDTGSYGFPYNELDKKVNDFGTLIHSKGDIDTMKRIIMQRIMDEETERVNNGTSESLNVSGEGTMEGLENSLNNDERESLSVSYTATSRVVGASGYTGEHAIYREAHAEPMHRKIEHTPSLDTLDSEGYQDIIEDGSVQYKHYLQYQGPYKGNQYRVDGTITSDGCGPTSVANLLSGYGKDVTPADVAAWAMEDIGSRDGPGPQLEHFGIEHDVVIGVGRKEFAEALINAFNDGKPVVAVMPEPQPDTDDFWTKVGHYVCLIGIDEEGRMITADPASMEERRISCENGIDDIVCYLCALWIPKEAPSGVKKGGKYKGYEGNEAVVSPVTGILLEYGTYDSDDDERINSDIDCKEIDQECRLTSTKENYKDKLGYAKIMVLDAENYKKLEAGTNSSFKDNSLLKSEYNTIGINQKFEEKLENDEELKHWSAIDQTIYGYKEFAELYEKTGIAGNIIYIDGFKCEDVAESDEKGPDKTFDGEYIDFKDFDVSEGDIENKDAVRPSLYERDTVYKDMNLKITERLKAEGKTKSNAVSSIGIDATGGKIVSNFDNKNRLVFIKEGTVLGRTITDKELMENTEYRNKKLGTYEDVRGKNPKVIGNYLRIIMRNSDDDSIIENVEDYMKLDEGEVKDNEINEWVLFYWCPYECGPWDGDGNGPEQVENHNAGGGEFSTGICQWTTTGAGHSAGSFDEIKKLCTFAANYDPAYSNMTSYGDLSISEKLNNFEMLNNVIKPNCSLDREKFLKMEVECALWQFLGGEYYEKYGNLGFSESELAQTYRNYPWVENRPDIIKGTVMSMAIRFGSEVPAQRGITDALSDQEIIDKIKEYFAGDSNRGEVQFNVANDYYNGAITDEDIETWVRTAHLDGHPEYDER